MKRQRPRIALISLLAAAVLLGSGEFVAPGPIAGPVIAVSAARAGSPLLIENVGQWPEAARFQVWGGGPALWLAEDALWLSVVERSHVDTLERSDVSTLARPHVGTLERANVQRVNVRLSFPGANPHPRLEPFDRRDTHVSYFLGNDPAGWRPDVPVWGGVRYVDLYPGIDLEVSGAGGRWAWQLVEHPDGLAPSPSEGEGGRAALARGEGLRLRIEGADAVAVDGGALHLSTAAGEVRVPLLAVEWPVLSLPKGVNVQRANMERADVSAFDVAAPFTTAGANWQSQIGNPQSGDLVYSTFLGGSGVGGNGWDWGDGIALDAEGRAYVTGWTTSSDFPTTIGVIDMNYNGGDAFVVKLNPSGSRLIYATFLGGSNSDDAHALAVDATGNAYVIGATWSSDFPVTPGAFDTSFNGSGQYNYDAFVVKLDPVGTSLVYTTFLGGSSADPIQSIAVDASGNAYVTGWTISNDFPVTQGTFDTSFNGHSDSFVVKLNPSGSNLDYATFLGGSSGAAGLDIAVDGIGHAYVVGYTASSDFPTTPSAFDTSHNGSSDAFVIKLNPTASTLVYATFLGGHTWDFGDGIAVDATGSAYVTGETRSSEFPTTPGAFDTSFNGGDTRGIYGDAFVVKVDPTGSALTYATLLGGSYYDRGCAIEIDATGSAYITGDTYISVTNGNDSEEFPTTPDAFDRSHNGEFDAFVVKLNSAGDTLAYATFLGGSRWDTGYAIAVDVSGRVHMAGNTDSSDFPVTPGAFDTAYNGGEQDSFVAKLLVGPPPPPPAIQGITWRDLNGDATRDAGEPGLAGVQVCAEPLGHRPIRCAISSPDGSYTIELDSPGTYLVAPSAAPAGMRRTTPGFHLPVVVREGEQVRDVDFGYR
jgi:hypothetical protein